VTEYRARMTGAALVLIPGWVLAPLVVLVVIGRQPLHEHPTFTALGVGVFLLVWGRVGREVGWKRLYRRFLG